MTIERRIVVGWEDVQCIVFECTSPKCGARIVVRRDADLAKTEPVDKCPNGHPWTGGGLSVNRTFGALKQQMTDGGKVFKVLLQFDEPALGHYLAGQPPQDPI